MNPQGMDEALKEAKNAFKANEIPVGAVVLHQGRVIARAYNLVEDQADPTAHAEILALRNAAAFLKRSILDDCDLYVTLEPCAMCAGAISWARIRRLYFGAYDPKSGGVEHGARVFSHPTCHHKPEVLGGIQEMASAKLLQRFFKDLREI